MLEMMLGSEMVLNLINAISSSRDFSISCWGGRGLTLQITDIDQLNDLTRF